MGWVSVDPGVPVWGQLSSQYHMLGDDIRDTKCSGDPEVCVTVGFLPTSLPHGVWLRKWEPVSH